VHVEPLGAGGGALGAGADEDGQPTAPARTIDSALNAKASFVLFILRRAYARLMSARDSARVGEPVMRRRQRTLTVALHASLDAGSNRVRSRYI
jgi:hypothetical protein